jgi:hypothetical protein
LRSATHSVVRMVPLDAVGAEILASNFRGHDHHGPSEQRIICSSICSFGFRHFSRIRSDGVSARHSLARQCVHREWCVDECAETAPFQGAPRTARARSQGPWLPSGSDYCDATPLSRRKADEFSPSSRGGLLVELIAHAVHGENISWTVWIVADLVAEVGDVLIERAVEDVRRIHVDGV